MIKINLHEMSEMNMENITELYANRRYGKIVERMQESIKNMNATNQKLRQGVYANMRPLNIVAGIQRNARQLTFKSPATLISENLSQFRNSIENITTMQVSAVREIAEKLSTRLAILALLREEYNNGN